MGETESAISMYGLGTTFNYSLLMDMLRRFDDQANYERSGCRISKNADRTLKDTVEGKAHANIIIKR